MLILNWLLSVLLMVSIGFNIYWVVRLQIIGDRMLAELGELLNIRIRLQREIEGACAPCDVIQRSLQ